MKDENPSAAALRGIQKWPEFIALKHRLEKCGDPLPADLGQECVEILDHVVAVADRVADEIEWSLDNEEPVDE